MRLHSLESRIVLLFLALILTVQLAGFTAIRAGIDENARAAIRDELTVGERVFKRLLEQNAHKLTQGANLLAKDYGFLSAIGTDDRDTVSSALANHGGRIGAAMTILIGADRRLRATTTSSLSASLEKAILELVDIAEKDGNATGTGIVGSLPFQIVVVPVKAPVTIGWVAMAFPIDQKLAEDLRELTSLQVSILTRRAGQDWIPSASTLGLAETADLAFQLRDLPDAPSIARRIALPDDEFSARIVRVERDGDRAAVAVLQRSIGEATAPYRQLQFTLLVLTALGIGIAAVLSIVTAKRITGPLKTLAATARQLGSGQYAEPIETTRVDEIGDLSRAFENMRRDISARELEIRKLAYWDTLTDLPNRAQFAAQLEEAIGAAQREGSSCHILMMDLDRFKNVNDVLGHAFGDALLRKVAARLKRQITSENSRLARLGGDEFAVLLPSTGLFEAQAVAARLLESLEKPLSLDDHTVDLGAGIGIAGYPEHGADAKTLLSHAEVAMYAAKKSGNAALVYDPSFDKGSQQSLSLLSELRRAADQDQFELFVQPKILLNTGAFIGFEALVRWNHPEKGRIAPDAFIPFAEKTGFIRVLTRWVLERAARISADLARRGIHPKISVNISTMDLLDQDLPAKFEAILARHGVTPDRFCLEITESAIMDDPVRALQTLDRLAAMGAELSIDDFGTGYSSLAYLKRLPVQELKIDKSFVMNMKNDADDAKIVRSTIDLGHNMGLRVVAEGIENEAVWRLLARMGCDQGQGYYISRPIPADGLEAWIRDWAPPVPLAPQSVA